MVKGEEMDKNKRETKEIILEFANELYYALNKEKVDKLVKERKLINLPQDDGTGGGFW